MLDPFTVGQLQSFCLSAIAKVDKGGLRGAETVTILEIEAMVTTLAIIGAPFLTATTDKNERTR